MEFFFARFAPKLQKLFMVYSISPRSDLKETYNTHMEYEGWRQFVVDCGLTTRTCV